MTTGKPAAIEAAHYEETRKRMTGDPIIIAMTADIRRGIESGNVTRDTLFHDSGTPKHGFMLAANQEYQHRGGTDGGHLGAVPEAIRTLLDAEAQS